MTPPCQSFAASRLPHQVQLDVEGRKRKLPGGGDVDLTQCELLTMVQYQCTVERPDRPNSHVHCWPIQRLFRRCKDKNGTFLVETTAWEGTATDSNSSHDDSTTKWHDWRKW